MERLSLAYEECSILPQKLGKNHNHFPKPKPKPKPKSNKWNQTKWIWQLHNYKLPIVKEIWH